MNSNFVKSVILTGATALMLLVSALAWSAVKGDQLAKGRVTAVSVLSSAATLVPTTPMKGRNAISIYNNGPNTIWCGFTSTVTTATGYPIPTLTSLGIDITCANVNTCPSVYCRASTADQASPADTRIIEAE